MLCLTLKPRELLQIDNLTMSIESSKGGHYKLHFGETVVWIKPDNEGRFHVRIDADKSIPVRRIKEAVEEPEQVEPEKPEEVLPIKSSSTQEILRNMMAANKRK